MLIKIIDCDHGDFRPEQEVADAHGVTLVVGQVLDPKEIIEFAKDADAILVQRVQITREIMKALPKLKVIGRYGSGVDNVDLDAARELGKRVVYTPYFCFVDVANHTLGYLLALTRRIPFVSAQWKSDPKSFNQDYDARLKHLQGVRRPSTQTLGIVGFGKIGMEVAKRAKVFGYTVHAYDPYVSKQWMQAQGVVPVGDFNTLLSQVDILTFHCPLTPETQGMMGAEQFKRLKPGSLLINCARGPIVQEKALIQALKDKQIAAAALDVQEIEPLPTSSALYGMEQVLITPHVAFYSQESFVDLKERITRYAIACFTGHGEFEAIA